MSYYSKKEWNLLGFRKAKTKRSMYSAIIYNKQNKQLKRTINFGDKFYENFSDRTGLNLYPKLIHGDQKRKENYRKRHKKDLREGYYSAGYFSWKYLWS